MNVTARAEAIAAYAAMPCATCGCRSAQHSDIGTCENCDKCMCFEES